MTVVFSSHGRVLRSMKRRARVRVKSSSAFPSGAAKRETNGKSRVWNDSDRSKNRTEIPTDLGFTSLYLVLRAIVPHYDHVSLQNHDN